jgi:hypothetical protein
VTTAAEVGKFSALFVWSLVAVVLLAGGAAHLLNAESVAGVLELLAGTALGAGWVSYLALHPAEEGQ